MKCTEKWFKQQLGVIKNSVQTKLKRHRDPTNYWRGYFEGYLKCVDEVLGLLVEREKELREIEKTECVGCVRSLTPCRICIAEFLGDVQK